ncbi:MAG: hypothetical protein J0I06_05970 [Planctomycetes bacterium]|nr:hypothetical protein [Planctomycetota bacterium]
MEPASAPPPFEIVETPAGRLYRLPPRQLGGLRVLAVPPLVVAVAVAAVLVNYYLTRAAKGPLDEWAWATFIASGIGWTRAGYTLVSLAAAIWCGRSEIEVTEGGAVWAADRVGWLRVHVGKLRPGAARKLVLSEFVPARDATGQPLTTGPVPLWSLTVETDRGGKVWLALAHPREVLAALADELANRLSIATPAPHNPDTGEPLPVATGAPVPVVVEEPEVPNRDVLEQPADSRVVLERHPDGVTVTVPPPGVWRASGGLLIVGGIFSLVGGGIVVNLLWLLWANPGLIGGEPVGVFFLLVGLALILAAVHYGRKRAVLAVVGDRLLTFETGPLGSRRREFGRAGLLDIACGPSNVSVNNKPLPQLQIVPAHNNQRVGMLTGRDEDELKWIATVLRQALGIPDVPPERREPVAGTPATRGR